ncbi:Hsp20/alpha crystallin family protein [Rhodopila sp.]|jgi:HSP20 family protein|uniref:Hsp20/alpha crystallin family protein n=1 Tax=Rhodopila sp. TaxID=2480087 RepID=UPI002CCD8489|nr:Hsp20/alpha crystallin family protein [Rhodopila sp.]HVZ08957.1 Hsp20/alpha crystallin family protein [Rhodopila sp.]
MANAPVEVRKPSEPSANAPESWRSFRTELDRLFDRFATDFRMPSLGRLFDASPMGRLAAAGMAVPAIDVTEDAESFKLTAELPGLTEKDVDISLADGMLTLKGEKKQELEQKDKSFYLSERSFGSFSRSFTLPETVNAEAITAAFDKGVLTVTLPKKAEAQAAPKKIEVKSST